MTAHHCPSWPCPICHPDGVITHHYMLPPFPSFSPPGCICPPTSERTCENRTCPRRGIKMRSATGHDAPQQGA